MNLPELNFLTEFSFFSYYFFMLLRAAAAAAAAAAYKADFDDTESLSSTAL